MLDARHDLGGVGELRHGARADERGRLDHREACPAQQVDEVNLVGGGDDALLVLQAVARAYLDNLDTRRQRPGSLRHVRILSAAQEPPSGSISISVSPPCTTSPAAWRRRVTRPA